MVMVVLFEFSVMRCQPLRRALNGFLKSVIFYLCYWWTIMINIIGVIFGVFVVFIIFERISVALGSGCGGCLGIIIGGVGIAAMGTAIGIPAIGVIIILFVLGGIFSSLFGGD